jgi:acyl-CoA hydrolase
MTLLEDRRTTADAVLDHIEEGADLIVGVANGEPRTVLDAIEANAASLRGVRTHQMIPLRERPSFGVGDEHLRHVSWFLSPHDRAAFAAGTCDLVPNNFSEIPLLMRKTTKRSLVLTAVAPPDRHGYFSLGCHAEYVAPMIGEVPFFVEVNPNVPRTFGSNQVHISQVVGWCEADYPMVEVPSREADAIDQRIAELVAERIPHRATIQAGIGAVPNAVLGLLHDHRDLGVHTELLAEGFVDLVESGAINCTCKKNNRNTIVATSALGGRRLYDFVDENPAVELWPVNLTNDPRVIAAEDHMNVINATLEVDFLGQCASESLGSHYWSSSGGQADYARGAMFAEHGQGFIVMRSTADHDAVSRIVPQLHPGAAVTTYKNIVDKVVTEHGVAELRGRSIRERTEQLIAIAHPKFRDELTAKGREFGYL